MISEATRLCIGCRRTLPDPPAAPVCGHCGRVHCVSHTEWSALLKWWLLAEFAATRFHEWKHPQEVWEGLLRDALNGIRVGKGPNPNGTHLSMSTPAVELYGIALQKAQAWKAAGSPIGAAIAPAKQTTQRSA